MILANPVRLFRATRTHSVRVLALIIAAGVTLVGLGSAKADQHKYIGAHPITKQTFCYIEAPHIHAYAPRNAKLLYRPYKGHHFFVGDPVAHKYDGDKHAYHGHHPVSVAVVVGDHDRSGDHVEFCYLNGPHFHAYAPNSHGLFRYKGGAYWYMGSFQPHYKNHRPKYVRVNVVYRRINYRRPVIAVTPPAGYVMPVVEVRGAKLHGGVRAGVQVSVPAARIDIVMPGVVVEHRHRKYKARRWHKHKHGYTHGRSYKYKRKYKYKYKYKRGRKYKYTRKRH